MQYNHNLPDNIAPDGDTCIPVFVPDDPQWIASFVSVVKLLHQDKRWVRDNVGGVDTLAVRNRWKQSYNRLIDDLSNGVGCLSSVDFDYSEQFTYYPPYAPLIEWLPISPYEDVDQTPQTMLLPAWNVYNFELPSWLNGFLSFFGTSFETITGYRRGDAFTTVLNLALGGKNITQILGDWIIDGEGFVPLDIGFNVHVRGEGILQLELLSVPQGSVVIYQVDGFPNITDALSGILDPNDDVIDTNRDLVAFPPELDAESLEEIKITGAGDHVVRVRVFPRLNDEGLFLSFGAGLRSVRLGDGLTALDWRTGQPFTQPSTGALGSNEEGLYLVTESEYNQLVSDVQTLQAFVANYCNELENCLPSSPIILSMQSSIADNLTNINDNTSDILLNKNNITALETRVTDNEVDIQLLKDNQNNLLRGTADRVEYDTIPDKLSQPDLVCGASWSIAERLEQFIIDTVNDASSITLLEFLQSSFGLGGYDESLLVTFWQFAVANANPNLLSDVNASVANVAEHFYCSDLDVATARSAIIADSGITTDAEAAWIGAIDAWLNSQFEEAIAIGKYDDTRDCSSFCPAPVVIRRLNGFANADIVNIAHAQGIATYDATNDWYEDLSNQGFNTFRAVRIEYTFSSPFTGTVYTRWYNMPTRNNNASFTLKVDGVILQTIPGIGANNATLSVTNATTLRFETIASTGASGSGESRIDEIVMTET